VRNRYFELLGEGIAEPIRRSRVGSVCASLRQLPRQLHVGRDDPLERVWRFPGDNDWAAPAAGTAAPDQTLYTTGGPPGRAGYRGAIIMQTATDYSATALEVIVQADSAADGMTRSLLLNIARAYARLAEQRRTEHTEVRPRRSRNPRARARTNRR
jgi:hypothetical protein